MSEIIRHVIREIYSEVLFELASESELVDAVREDLQAVGHVLSENGEFAALMNSAGIKGQEKSEVVRRVFGGKVNDLTLDFLSVLAKKNRMSSLFGISKKYEMMFDVHYDRQLVEVTLSGEPGAERLQELEGQLSEAIGGAVKLAVEVDPEIIGGIIIRKDGRMIDNSVRTAIQVAMKTVVDKSKTKITGSGESGQQ